MSSFQLTIDTGEHDSPHSSLPTTPATSPPRSPVAGDAVPLPHDLQNAALPEVPIALTSKTCLAMTDEEGTFEVLRLLCALKFLVLDHAFLSHLGPNMVTPLPSGTAPAPPPSSAAMASPPPLRANGSTSHSLSRPHPNALGSTSDLAAVELSVYSYYEPGDEDDDDDDDDDDTDVDDHAQHADEARDEVRDTLPTRGNRASSSRSSSSSQASRNTTITSNLAQNMSSGSSSSRASSRSSSSTRRRRRRRKKVKRRQRRVSMNAAAALHNYQKDKEQERSASLLDTSSSPPPDPPATQRAHSEPMATDPPAGLAVPPVQAMQRTMSLRERRVTATAAVSLRRTASTASEHNNDVEQVELETPQEIIDFFHRLEQQMARKRSGVASSGPDFVDALDLASVVDAIPDDLEAKERVWYEAVYSHIALGERPGLRSVEHSFYSELWEAIVRQGSASELFGYVEMRFNRHTKTVMSLLFSKIASIIRTLRQLEQDPGSWHRGGFFNMIDNYLAALLYRRGYVSQSAHLAPERLGFKGARLSLRSQTRPDDDGLVADAADADADDADDAKEEAQPDPPQEPPPPPNDSKQPSPWFGYPLALALIGAGVIAFVLLWYTWNTGSATTVTDVLNDLSSELLSRVSGEIKVIISTAPAAARLVQNSYALGSLNFTAAWHDDSASDRELVKALLAKGISGAYVAAPDTGLFLGAFRLDSTDADPSNVSASILHPSRLADTIVIMTVNEPSFGCLQVYDVGSDLQRNRSAPLDPIKAGLAAASAFAGAQRDVSCPSGLRYTVSPTHEWIDNAASTNTSSFSEVFKLPSYSTPGDANLRVSLSEPVFSLSNDQSTVAYLGIDVDFNEVSDILGRVSYAESGVAFLLERFTDERGYGVLASSTSEQNLAGRNDSSSNGLIQDAASFVAGLPQPTLRGERTDNDVLISSDAVVLALISPTPGAGGVVQTATRRSTLELIVATAFPLDDFDDDRVRNNAITFILGIVALACAAALFIMSYIVPPLQSTRPQSELVLGMFAIASPTPRNRKRLNHANSSMRIVLDDDDDDPAEADDPADADDSPSDYETRTRTTHTTTSDLDLAALEQAAQHKTSNSNASATSNVTTVSNTHDTFWDYLPQWQLVVMAMTLALIACVASVYLLWDLSTRDDVSDIQSATMNETASAAGVTTEIIARVPVTMAGLLELQYGNGIEQAAFLYNLMHSFLEATGQFSVSRAVYARESDGAFVGIEVGDLQTRSTTLLLARDETNGFCYTKYQTVVAALPGMFGSERIARGPKVYESQHCSFDPRVQPWYEMAKSSRKPAWTPLQLLSQDEGLPESVMGITFTVPVFNGSQLAGVIGVDLPLDFISTSLDLLQIGRDDSDLSGLESSASSFVVQRDSSLLIAATKGEVTQSLGSFVTPTPGAQASDPEISAAARFLNLDGGGLSTLPSTVKQHDRSLSAPLLVTVGVEDEYGVDWVVGVVVPRGVFLDDVEAAGSLSFLAAVAVVMCVLYMVSSSAFAISLRVIEDESHEEALRSLGGTDVTRADLEELMDNIRPDIIRAANSHPDCPAKPGRWDLLPFDSLYSHYSKLALQHIRDCRGGQRNILSMSKLSEHDAQWPLKLYMAYSKRLYFWFVQACILVHIMLVFVEPQTPEELESDGLPTWLVALEIVLLTVETIDIAVKCTILFGFKTHNILAPSSDALVALLRAALMIALIVDFVIVMQFRVSIGHIIPFRGLLLVLRNYTVRNAAYNFFRTLYRARDVFLLFLLTVLIAAVMGMMLFRDNLGLAAQATASNNDLFVDSDRPRGVVGIDENSFINFGHAVLSAFVYVSTGENYTETVYPAFDISPWYLVYFVVFLLVGSYAILSILIASYEEQFRNAEAELLRKRTLFSRVGAVAAFLLLDLNSRRSVRRRDFEEFLRELSPMARLPGALAQIVKPLAAKSSSHRSFDIAVFVKAVEDISLRLRYDDAATKRSSWLPPWIYTKLREAVDSDWADKIVFLLLLLQGWLYCLYGAANEASIDMFIVAINAFYVLELATKLVAYGPHKYWNYAYYLRRTRTGMVDSATMATFGSLQKQRDRLNVAAFDLEFFDSDDEDQPPQHVARQAASKQRQIMFANRSHLVIVSLTVLSAAVAALGDADPDLVRFCLTFSLLRIPFMVDSLLQLGLAIKRLLPVLAPVCLLLVIIMLAYAQVGVTLFAGKFDRLQDSAPEGNFDTTSDALLTLLQLLSGESWHTVMYAAINCTGWAAAAFFVTYILVVTLLFSALFTGLFINARRFVH